MKKAIAILSLLLASCAGELEHPQAPTTDDTAQDNVESKESALTYAWSGPGNTGQNPLNPTVYITRIGQTVTQSVSLQWWFPATNGNMVYQNTASYVRYMVNYPSTGSWPQANLYVRLCGYIQNVWGQTGPEQCFPVRTNLGMGVIQTTGFNNALASFGYLASGAWYYGFPVFRVEYTYQAIPPYSYNGDPLPNGATGSVSGNTVGVWVNTTAYTNP